MSNRERYMWCLTHSQVVKVFPNGLLQCFLDTWWPGKLMYGDSGVERQPNTHKLTPLDKALTKRGERRRRVKK